MRKVERRNSSRLRMASTKSFWICSLIVIDENLTEVEKENYKLSRLIPGPRENYDRNSSGEIMQPLALILNIAIVVGIVGIVVYWVRRFAVFLGYKAIEPDVLQIARSEERR